VTPAQQAATLKAIDDLLAAGKPKAPDAQAERDMIATYGQSQTSLTINGSAAMDAARAKRQVQIDKAIAPSVRPIAQAGCANGLEPARLGGRS
jgi:hypothetical protein